MPGKYKLTFRDIGLVERTTWWKDESEPAGVWWIEGPAVSRQATDIEIDLWLPRAAMREDNLICATRTAIVAARREDKFGAARTAIVAMMAAIMQVADSDRMYEECVVTAQSLYKEAKRQVEERGLCKTDIDKLTEELRIIARKLCSSQTR